MVRIGYQGEVGSNNEQASKMLAERQGITDAEWVPLIHSGHVIDALVRGNIDYGVMAIRNNLGGRVSETAEALYAKQLHLVDSVVMEIHHCVFKRPGVPNEELKFVTSHPQALAQTAINRAQQFPNLEEVDSDDTARAAMLLASGYLSDRVAVICRMNAGEENGLELVAENIEDRVSHTEFNMYQMPKQD